MIYLVLTFVSLFILFFVAYTGISTFISKSYAKQTFYESINTDKNILLLYLIKISNVFVPVLKSIKLSDKELQELIKNNIKINLRGI